MLFVFKTIVVKKAAIYYRNPYINATGKHLLHIIKQNQQNGTLIHIKQTSPKWNSLNLLEAAYKTPTNDQLEFKLRRLQRIEPHGH